MSTTKSILTRIREFQQDLESIEIMRNTEGYGYEYADLNSILKIITPFLKKHNIWYYHYTNFDECLKRNVINTKIYCIDNESDLITSSTSIDGEAILGGMNRFQVEGSALTYFRRYHLVTLLGLLTEEDSDAAGKRKQKTPKNTQNSNNSNSKEADKAIDFVGIFKDMIAKEKPVDKIKNTLNMYKEQISNQELKTINQLIIEYEKK